MSNDKKVKLVSYSRGDGGLVESRLTLMRYDDQVNQGAYQCAVHNEYGSAHDERDIARRSYWQKLGKFLKIFFANKYINFLVDFANTLPSSYRIGALVGMVSIIVLLLLFCCMCCHCCESKKNGKSRRSCLCCCCRSSKSSNYSRKCLKF